MKVTYIANSTIPSRSASSVHVMKMCQAFARDGHDVTLLASQEPADLEPGVGNAHAFYGVDEIFALRGIPLGRHRGRGWAYSWRCLRAARGLRTDLVYSRYLPASVFAALRGYPTVLELHGLRLTRSAEDRLLLRTLRRLPALRRVVVISRQLKADLLSAVDFDADKVVVAHDGADQVVGHSRPPEMRREPSRMQVGYVGHLYPGRGTELIREMAERLPDLDFHVVGGRPADVERMRRAATLPKNLDVHGFMPYRAAEAFRVHCDVLIAPYQDAVATLGARTDTSPWMSPLKIFEYMAAGKAIVCSDIPVLREVLEHRRTALLAPPDDLAAWVSALACLAREGDLRQRLGAAALQEFRDKYTWQGRARAVLEGVLERVA